MIAFILIGISKTNALKARINKLEIFRSFVISCKNQMMCMQNSIEEITEVTVDSFSKKLRSELKKSVFPIAFTKCTDEFFVYKEDKNYGKRFLNEFGRYDCERECDNMNLLLADIEEKINSLKTKLKEKSQTNIVFYSFLGFAITIVLA